MADQTINMTMHTLNKYGVPCADVTDYANAESGNSGDTFYLQKHPYEYLVRTKIKGAALTGIPGYAYCHFRNVDDNGVVKGYCDYYSLQNGQLITTVELPFSIGGQSFISPMADINSDFVVYSAIEFIGDVTKYNRFRRNDHGELTHEGRVLLDRGYYFPSTVLYLGGINPYSGGDPTIPPRDIPAADINVDLDTITLNDHGLVLEDWVLFNASGTMPGGLDADTWYVVVNPTQNTFQLANTPPDYNDGEVIDITGSGFGDMTMLVDWGYYAYDNALLYDFPSIYPSNIKLDRLYVNRLGGDKQTGRVYYEALPDLSADSLYKRIALGYIDLFVGDLAIGTEYVVQTPFYNLLAPDVPDRNTYTMPVNIFNDSVDDGSELYVVGSGYIQARWYNGGQTMMIGVFYDDIRGASGNQLYQKWHDSFGTYAYTWVCPSYTYNGGTALYTMYPRIDEGMVFFYLGVNQQTGEAYLWQYHLMTGQLIAQHQLVNPTFEVDGLAYRLTNQQLIAGRYLMLHTNASYHVFFDVWNPNLGIRGQITMDGVEDVYGFLVVPEVSA